MLFHSVHFLVFFPVVTLLYFVLPKKVRIYWLLAASYYFYMCWNPVYSLLMLLSTAITFASGLLIRHAGETLEGAAAVRRKKLWVALSFLLNLAILFFFKYFNFAVESRGGSPRLMFFCPWVSASIPSRRSPTRWTYIGAKSKRRRISSAMRYS